MDRLRIVCFLSIVMFLFSCESSSQITKRILKDDLEVVSYWKIERGEFGSIYITGVLRNKSDRELSFVSIEFPLCDSSGNTIGTAMDTISNLKPGQSWKYKVLVTEREVRGVCEGRFDIVAF